jgi:ribose-phosphate pyrophosphokinase
MAEALSARRAHHVRHMFPNGNQLVELSSEPTPPGVVCLYVVPDGSPGEQLIELGLLVDAVRRSWDSRIIAVFPYLPYCRGHNVTVGSSFAAKVYIDLLSHLALDALILIDLHPQSLASHVAPSPMVLTVVPSLATDLQTRGPLDLVVGVDKGVTASSALLARHLRIESCVLTKARPSHGGAPVFTASIPELAGATVVLFDDEILTGGSMLGAAALLQTLGARQIHIACIHPLFRPHLVHDLFALPSVSSITTTNLFGLDAERGAGFHVLDVSSAVAQAVSQVARRFVNASE